MPFPFTVARWVWTADAGDARWAVRRFRSQFTLTEAQTVTVYVCADSRYELFCNGERVGRGPARSDVRHQMFDTYSLSLTAGTHTLAASVLTYAGADSPIAEMHDRGAWLCEAHGADGAVLSATGRDGDWRVLADDSVRPVSVTQQDGYYGIGASETVDGARFPHGWETPEFDVGAWEVPVGVADAWPRERTVDYGDPAGRWRLVPRDIPYPRDEARQFITFASTSAAAKDPLTPDNGGTSDPLAPDNGGTGLVLTPLAEGVSTSLAPPLLGAGGGNVSLHRVLGGAIFDSVTVAASSRQHFIVTPGEYAIGFPVLSVSGGTGAVVKLTYAEALTVDGKKDVRDTSEANADVAGFSDTYICGGGREMYRPLHWRAFRFVQVTVETQDAPVTVHSLSFQETSYPWQYGAAFEVNNGPAQLPAVLETDFRTLRCCTDETFMDCPYYEQLQYVGDTRLQALLSYVTTGDTRLGARAVRLFDWSRGPDGLTQSRYPSRMEQIIPTFSLIWVLMCEDLARYAPAETQTVRDILPGCRNVLDWFGRHVGADGVLPGRLPWWNFVDWTAGFVDGAPAPFAAGRPCATINLQYLAALQACTRLHAAHGNERERAHRQAQAEQLSDAISRTFWDAERGLLREGPIADAENWGFTQHAQAWGILTDVMPAEAVQSVCDSLHTDESLSPATYYHSFYVVEALAKAGRLEQLWTRWLLPWQDALKLGLSTWPEQPEPTRSDCHAWSAWPTYAFLTHVLGVKPNSIDKAGYAVSPTRVDGWDTVMGTAALPTGAVRVSVTWGADGTAQVTHSPA